MRTHRDPIAARTPTAGEQALGNAGISLDELVRRLGYRGSRCRSGRRYVRAILLHGRASDQMCRKLGKALGCSPNIFFFSPAYWAAVDASDSTGADQSAGAGQPQLPSSPPDVARRPACRRGRVARQSEFNVLVKL